MNSTTCFSAFRLKQAKIQWLRALLRGMASVQTLPKMTPPPVRPEVADTAGIARLALAIHLQAIRDTRSRLTKKRLAVEYRDALASHLAELDGILVPTQAGTLASLETANA